MQSDALCTQASDVFSFLALAIMILRLHGLTG